MMNGLWNSISANVGYVLSFLAIILALFVLAFWLEKLAMKRSGERSRIFTTRKVVMIGMFSAVSVVLMMFEIPVPFALSFYKLDFSELPILIGAFAFGPAAGVMMEFVKILLKLLIKGTSTAFVGELANFAVGCSLVLPASCIYRFRKTKRAAVLSLVAGTLVMTVFGTAFNAVYLLPAFAALYGMPLESLIAMGSAVNPLVREGSVFAFVVACVAPLNLLKGTADSLIAMLVYKPLSPILKGNG